MNKCNLLWLGLLFIYQSVLAQTYPRDQLIMDAEYFLNTDPGEGKATPISGSYGFADASITLNLKNVGEGTVIYVRFKSSNGTWSAPRQYLYKPPLPNSGAYLKAAEYFINTDPGIGNGTTVTVNGGGSISSFILTLKESEYLYLRVKDSYDRWSAPMRAQYANRGAYLIAAEYFINHDPGIGKANAVHIVESENILIPHLPLNLSDRLYVRVKDSFMRWSPARVFRYTYQKIIAAEYKWKYKNGNEDVSFKPMEIQPHPDITSSFYSAIVKDTSVKFSDTDTIRIRFYTYDILGNAKCISEISEKFELPLTYSLWQNYPNPFNPKTTIKYSLAKSCIVKMEIYNILGQKVSTLVNGMEQPGQKSVVWDGRNDAGEQLSSGMYIYRLEAGKFTFTRKLIILK